MPDDAAEHGVRVTAVDQGLPAKAGLAGAAEAGRTWRATAAGYLALTKPRIIELLLVTTVPTMVLAAGGLPPLGLVLATLGGGTLAAGGANALNSYVDRDIDAVMHRTANRPLATGALAPRSAMIFGLALSVASVVWLASLVNLLSAALAAVAIGFYVGVYTLGLKRRTAQNIVWGGAAGCMPVLIGWAAVRDGLGWPPVVLFLVIFFWTPPHYWPLSMRFREDYAAAGVPMLPVQTDPVTVAGWVLAYSWVMVATSLLLWPVAATTWFYPVVAGVIGVVFLSEAHRLRRRARAGLTGAALGTMRLFHWSITYLSLLFVAVAVDSLLPR